MSTLGPIFLYLQFTKEDELADSNWIWWREENFLFFSLPITVSQGETLGVTRSLNIVQVQSQSMGLACLGDIKLIFWPHDYHLLTEVLGKIFDYQLRETEHTGWKCRQLMANLSWLTGDLHLLYPNQWNLFLTLFFICIVLYLVYCRRVVSVLSLHNKSFRITRGTRISEQLNKSGSLFVFDS